MTPDRPTLAELAAGLRIATAQALGESWLPEAIQTLILTCLGRLFDRLETLLQLWQSGQLPVPSSRMATPGIRLPAARISPPRHPAPHSRITGTMAPSACPVATAAAARCPHRGPRTGSPIAAAALPITARLLWLVAEPPVGAALHQTAPPCACPAGAWMQDRTRSSILFRFSN